MKALEDSINHWARMAHDPLDCFARGEIPAATNCALCVEFSSGATVRCKGCPVFKKTGRSGCEGTPYHHAYELWERKDFGMFSAQANKMVKFLESLRQRDHLLDVRQAVRDAIRIADTAYLETNENGTEINLRLISKALTQIRGLLPKLQNKED